LVARDLLRVIYAPHKVFKEIIKNPSYLGPMILLIIFVLAQLGSSYVVASKTVIEQTMPLGDRADEWTANALDWNSNQGVKISNNTIDFICSLPLDHIIVHILFYDMGSDLWVEAVKEGKISKDEFEVPSIIERGLSNFTYDELINYQNIVARKFYMRIKYIIKQIIKSINDKDSLRLKQIIRVLISLQFKNFLFPIDVHK